MFYVFQMFHSGVAVLIVAMLQVACELWTVCVSQLYILSESKHKLCGLDTEKQGCLFSNSVVTWYSDIS